MYLEKDLDLTTLLDLELLARLVELLELLPALFLFYNDFIQDLRRRIGAWRRGSLVGDFPCFLIFLSFSSAFLIFWARDLAFSI